jgi:hypothetical protein
LADGSRQPTRLLRPYYDVEIVGEGKAEKEFANLEIAEVLQHFADGRTKGEYRAVLVDLALTTPAEEAAGKQWSTDEAASQSFYEWTHGDETRALGTNLTGITVVEKILQQSPELAVAILSNYVHVSTVVNLISQRIGPARLGSWRLFSKKQQGIHELCEWLLKADRIQRP